MILIIVVVLLFAVVAVVIASGAIAVARAARLAFVSGMGVTPADAICVAPFAIVSEEMARVARPAPGQNTGMVELCSGAAPAWVLMTVLAGGAIMVCRHLV